MIRSFPEPHADHVEVGVVWYFKSYYEAKEYMKANRDGFPGMRVVRKEIPFGEHAYTGSRWVIEVYEDGPMLGPAIESKEG
tara:strand:+ start:983 stop:1225 length:243 start_codon:yes stop_codon:yes gene_type:complete